jgi:hypothetical protein
VESLAVTASDVRRRIIARKVDGAAVLCLQRDHHGSNR